MQIEGSRNLSVRIRTIKLVETLVEVASASPLNIFFIRRSMFLDQLLQSNLNSIIYNIVTIMDFSSIHFFI